MLKQLRQEVFNQVKEAIEAKQSTTIAGVKVSIVDCGSQDVFIQVNDENFGRFNVAEFQYVKSVSVAVFDAVKAKFRDQGPEAALEAVMEALR
jgi:hypothetical protein